MESGTGDKPMIIVDYQGEAMMFHPQEIFATFLTKMKEAAVADLGIKVNDAVVTVPTPFRRGSSLCPFPQMRGRVGASMDRSQNPRGGNASHPLGNPW